MMNQTVCTAATSDASVTIDVAADGVDVQSIQKLLARERHRLIAKAIVVVISRVSTTAATRWRNCQRSIREAILPSLLLMSQSV